MADTLVQITPGSGIGIDTRTETTNGNHRQVVVLGDPNSNDGVAPVSPSGGLKIDPATRIAGEDLVADVQKVEQRFNYTRVTPATTATTLGIKNGSGLLHGILIGTASTGGGTLTVYDNTAGSGTIITVIDTANQRGFIVLNCLFATGLTVVTSATTTAADLTAIYR